MENRMPQIDPSRTDIQPPIPTRPADPAAAGDEDKVAGVAPLVGRPETDQTSAASQTPSGPSIDHVGGPGLGVAPEDEADEMATTRRVRDSQADDPQDRRDH
jgi:hypothetical protein